jgi:hypothetical protein
MMNKLLLSALAILTLAFSACSSNDDNLNSAKLRELVLQALDGNHEANVELKGFIDREIISRKDFNSITIDSGYINKKYYFSVLLEYFDPLLNRFAIYDNKLRLCLIDKSLNGNLSAEWIAKENRNFVFVQEKFLTKDVLNIDRLSIYEVDNSTADLVYRSISKLVRDKTMSSQTIEKITTDFIVTKISGKTDLNSINQTDTFYFDSDSRKYLSSKNLFNNFVKEEITDFRWIITKPQIPAENFNDNALPEFFIDLNEEWVRVSFHNEDKLLKSSLTGTKYINDQLKTAITIFEIPFEKAGEDYSLYPFGNTTGGNYKKRSTGNYTMDKNYNQLFEHSCGDKKYLLLFDCPKKMYEQNRRILDKILNSFKIDC